MKKRIFWKAPHLFLLALLFLSTAYITQAQTDSLNQDEAVEYVEEGGRVYILDLNFTIANGMGMFGENLGNVLPGFTLASLWQLQDEKPGFLGFKYAYMHHSAYIYEYTAVVGPDLVEFDSRTSSNMMDLLANYRFYAPRRIFGVDPYIDFLLGVKFLYTYTNDVAIDGGPGGDFSIDEFSVSPSYGVGFGVHIPVKDGYYINAKTSIMNGLSTDYWVKDPDPGFISDSRNAFLPKSSPINLLQFELGMAFLY